MNWLHFISWTAGTYLAYYLTLILSDLRRSRSTEAAGPPELSFTEDILPKKIVHPPDKTGNTEKPLAKAESPITGSGGVSLKALFGLCREEAIIYTRPVSF